MMISPDAKRSLDNKLGGIIFVFIAEFAKAVARGDLEDGIQVLIKVLDLHDEEIAALRELTQG